MPTARASGASPAAHAALEEAARRAEAGRPGARPDTAAGGGGAYAAHNVIQSYEVSPALADEYDRHRHLLSPVLRDYLDAARAVPEEYDEARRVARRARNALADATVDYDAILTFSTTTGAAPEGLGSPIFNRLWTLLGGPCVNMSGLRGPHDLPVGIQIAGRFGRDKAALNVARFVEKAIAEG